MSIDDNYSVFSSLQLFCFNSGNPAIDVNILNTPANKDVKTIVLMSSVVDIKFIARQGGVAGDSIELDHNASSKNIVVCGYNTDYDVRVTMVDDSYIIKLV